jgi:hypothetical protein
VKDATQLYKVVKGEGGSNSKTSNSQPIMTVVNVHPALSRNSYKPNVTVDATVVDDKKK